MPGYLEDPTRWRLRTQNGVPYKTLGLSGEADDEHAEANMRVLIPSNRLYDFLVDLLPPPLRIGNLIVPQASSLPGFPNMVCRNVKFKHFDESLPVDPFGFDPSAPAGTYHPTLECEITYDSSVKKRDTNEEDPTTFLEISGNTTGEFLHTTAPRAKWRKRRNPRVTPSSDNRRRDVDPDPDPLLDWIPGEVGPLSDWVVEESDKLRPSTNTTTTSTNKNPTIPVVIVVPMTEWTVKWTQIPYELYRDIIVHRLRIIMGRVNSRPYKILFNASPGTLLFMGFNHTQKHTWRTDVGVETPPINLEMKFVEKHIIWDGVIRGHNDFWNPDTGGWDQLLIDGVNPTYLNFDFNRVHQL